MSDPRRLMTDLHFYLSSAVDTDFLEAWLTAMETGMIEGKPYLKGHASLGEGVTEEGVPKLCCQGVACELLVRTGRQVMGHTMVYAYGDVAANVFKWVPPAGSLLTHTTHDAYWPHAIADALGIPGLTNILANINDHHWWETADGPKREYSHQDIAKHIREKWEQAKAEQAARTAAHETVALGSLDGVEDGE